MKLCKVIFSIPDDEFLLFGAAKFLWKMDEVLVVPIHLEIINGRIVCCANPPRNNKYIGENFTETTLLLTPLEMWLLKQNNTMWNVLP